MDARLAAKRAIPDGVIGEAEWSSERRSDGTPAARFSLRWTHPDRKGPVNMVVGMNPSAAAEGAGDLTVLKCWEFCGRWNNGSLLMANVNPYRATDPREQVWSIDLRLRNEEVIRSLLPEVKETGGIVVVAWGAPQRFKCDVDEEAFYLSAGRIYEAARRLEVPVMCLGTTKNGHPRHPSRVAYRTPLVPWTPA